jgi:hypothetical protein
MRSSPRGRFDAILGALLLGGAMAGALALATAAGCSFSANDDATGFPLDDTGAADISSDAQIIDIGDDTFVSPDKLCGESRPGSCIPDLAATCTMLDAGSDGGSEPEPDASSDEGSDISTDVRPDPIDATDAADATDGDATKTDARSDAPSSDAADGGDRDAFDSAGSGTLRACRVIRDKNQPVTACAPAGTAPKDAWCTSDADCRPGLTCVGTPSGRCLAYCCTATASNDPCQADRRYCTPLPLAERPTDRVPVCVEPDRCTLLAREPEERCPATTTCTVVTKYGDTSCVPVGTGRDLACCDTTACDEGYVCLGTAGDRRCRKLCHEGADTECATGACERVSSIPAGFGICSVADAGAIDAAGPCTAGR